MYVPKHFKEERPEVMHQLMRSYPFGTLVTMNFDGPEASHLPFVLDIAPPPYGTLRGHIARANPQWSNLSPDVEALVIFQGPQAYISPSWYATKQETGKVVPTWNYAVVHAYGKLRIMHDQRWLLDHVEQLTNQQESGRKKSWKVSDAPVDFTNKLLHAIVGIELEVSRLIGKWKLGQNRPLADQTGVMKGLSADGDAFALSMLRLLSKRA